MGFKFSVCSCIYWKWYSSNSTKQLTYSHKYTAIMNRKRSYIYKIKHFEHTTWFAIIINNIKMVVFVLTHLRISLCNNNSSLSACLPACLSVCFYSFIWCAHYLLLSTVSLSRMHTIESNEPENNIFSFIVHSLIMYMWLRCIAKRINDA